MMTEVGPRNVVRILGSLEEGGGCLSFAGRVIAILPLAVRGLRAENVRAHSKPSKAA